MQMFALGLHGDVTDAECAFVVLVNWAIMQGGYLEDRYDNGGSYRDPFQLYHWDLIDVLVYFSHSFVTIPPHSWVAACHKRNTLVLGTLITDWDEGAKSCAQLFESVESAHFLACKLADIAFDYGDRKSPHLNSST